MILTLDPGKKEAGVALWEDGSLVDAWLTRAKKERAEQLTWHYATAQQVYEDITERGHRIDTISTFVGECPEVYPGKHQKGRQSDVVELALVTGAVGALVQPETITIYLPKEWKRNVPKEIVEKRVNRRLYDEEKERIEWCKATTLWHNIYDGIGIGMKYLRRWWC